MADSTKVQKLKLANSRKKFKELQELKKKKNEKAREDIQKVNKSNDLTQVDSMTNSSHSSVNNEVSEFIDSSLHLPKDTNNISDNHYQPSPAMFFDNLVQEDHNESSYKDLPGEDKSNNMSNYFNTLTQVQPDTTFSNINSSLQNISGSGCDQKSYSLFSQNSDNFEYQVKKDELQENRNDPSADLIIKNEESEDDSECEINEASDRTKLEIQHSNVESLKQLSNQMAELIEPQFCLSDSSQYDRSITDLEKRNLELATMLNQEKVNFEKQNIVINELQSKVIYLESVIKEKEEMASLQSRNELTKLKEELQSHLQTIGMLVAEKTELSVSLNKYELCSKQKVTECEELQARLKASRSRVAELEKEITNMKLEKNQYENSLQESNTLISTLKKDYNVLKEEKEELVQDLLETREKLKNSLDENLKLQQLTQELNSKLALSDLKLQQITTTDRQKIETDLNNIAEEKFHLEKKVADLERFLKLMTKERDESVLQYQQYAQQQNTQLNGLTKTLEHLQLENENLNLREQNRIKHISELEKQLQSLQSEQVALALDKSNGDSNPKLEIDNVKELCVQLQMEKITMEENYTRVSNEKDMLLKELEAKNDSLSQLEGLVEQLQGNQPDSVKLLATMESDKIAAARAVQQNKELKQHVESLEEVFLKLNNDKVELTEQLNKEIRNNKDLLQKLQKTEIHLQRLAEAVEIKDRELLDLRHEMANIKKHNLQNEQVNDLIRHYEVQETCSHALHTELKDAKETVVRLTNEINILKHSLNENQSSVMQNKDSDLQLENNKKELNDTNLKNEGSSIETIETSHLNKVLDRELAIQYLEEKFKRTMQDIADLKEEKQNLEHLVLQLQGETETIGEYVALYHHQRMMLKQKASEKDQQLKQLTNDREHMKTKLEKLDSLIKKLVGKNSVESLSKADATLKSEYVCENHPKLHEEITDINDEILQDTNKNSEVAEIVSLLSEIKSSNLVQPKENVHHCAWCSGQLIIV